MERVVRCRTINASGKSKAEIAFEERGGQNSSYSVDCRGGEKLQGSDQ